MLCGNFLGKKLRDFLHDFWSLKLKYKIMCCVKFTERGFFFNYDVSIVNI